MDLYAEASAAAWQADDSSTSAAASGSQPRPAPASAAAQTGAPHLQANAAANNGSPAERRTVYPSNSDRSVSTASRAVPARLPQSQQVQAGVMPSSHQSAEPSRAASTVQECAGLESALSRRPGASQPAVAPVQQSASLPRSRYTCAYFPLHPDSTDSLLCENFEQAQAGEMHAHVVDVKLSSLLALLLA